MGVFALVEKILMFPVKISLNAPPALLSGSLEVPVQVPNCHLLAWEGSKCEGAPNIKKKISNGKRLLITFTYLHLWNE